MKFKKGDRVKVTFGDASRYKKATIIETDRKDSSYEYQVRFDESGDTNIYNDSDLELILSTLEDMPEGTVIESAGGNERKVLFVFKPGLYVVSPTDGLDEVSTIPIRTAAELKRDGHKIKGQESDTVDIEVEGKTKTISRQSAKELNLID